MRTLTTARSAMRSSFSPTSTSIDRRHALCCGAAAVGGLFTSLLDAANATAPRPPLEGGARELVDRALASLDGEKAVTNAHLRRIAAPALRHRLRRNPLDDAGSTVRIDRAVAELFGE